MATKAAAVKIKLESSAGTGHFYTVYINKKNRQMKGQGKLELMKYDPTIRKRVLYKEKKIK